jgi:hypothetical protein
MNNTIETTDVLENNKKIIFKALKALKIKEVFIDYNGYGDSGQINEINFQKASGKSVNISKLSNGLILKGLKRTAGWTFPTPLQVSQTSGGFMTNSIPNYEDVPSNYQLREAIQDLCYDLLEQRHPGWEINSGSDGTFVFNVTSEKIKWEHNDIIEERDLHEYEV